MIDYDGCIGVQVTPDNINELKKEIEDFFEKNFEDYKIKKRCDRLKVHEAELFIYFIEKLKKVIESMPKVGEEEK